MNKSFCTLVCATLLFTQQAVCTEQPAHVSNHATQAEHKSDADQVLALLEIDIDQATLLKLIELLQLADHYVGEHIADFEHVEIDQIAVQVIKPLHPEPIEIDGDLIVHGDIALSGQLLQLMSKQVEQKTAERNTAVEAKLVNLSEELEKARKDIAFLTKKLKKAYKRIGQLEAEQIG